MLKIMLAQSTKAYPTPGDKTTSRNSPPPGPKDWTCPGGCPGGMVTGRIEPCMVLDGLQSYADAIAEKFEGESRVPNLREAKVPRA